jgi:hypothetical protein
MDHKILEWKDHRSRNATGRMGEDDVKNATAHALNFNSTSGK